MKTKEADTKPSSIAGRPGSKTGSITCKDICKHFRLRDDLGVTSEGDAPQSGPSLNKALARLLPGLHHTRRSFTALEGINLTIEPGEAVAFLRSNGSGKSTLLKIIAGVMQPTSGRLTVEGRVAALLELGAGLHDDLSGYENIFLAGRVYGFTDTEIRQRLPRIVDFTGLGRFLDAPVRTYSSGMFARLAFTIATEVDPDIILIDEILSVGDADFQARSFQRIREYSIQGRTMVIVSHNPEAVEQLTKRCVWLKNGQIIEDGPTSSVMNAYHRQVGRFIGGSAGFSAREMLAKAPVEPEDAPRTTDQWAGQLVTIGEIERIEKEGAEMEAIADMLRFRAPVIFHPLPMSPSPASSGASSGANAPPPSVDLPSMELRLILATPEGISLLEVEAPASLINNLQPPAQNSPERPAKETQKTITIELPRPNLLASIIEVHLVARMGGKTIASAPHPHHLRNRNLNLPIPEVLTRLDANWSLDN